MRWPLLIFPEGATTTGRGLAGGARRAGRPAARRDLAATVPSALTCVHGQPVDGFWFYGTGASPSNGVRSRGYWNRGPTPLAHRRGDPRGAVRAAMLTMLARATGRTGTTGACTVVRRDAAMSLCLFCFVVVPAPGRVRFALGIRS